MGLDMSLTADHFMWTYKPEQKELAKQIAELIGIDATVQSVKFEAGYWRKANQIHKWFVDNVQGGVDNCSDHYVDVAKLTELKKLCTILLDCYEATGTEDQPISDEFSDLCQKHLPPFEGFFFGSYEIDQYYVQDLKDTVAILEGCEKLSDDHPGLDFKYHSSW